MNEEAIAKIALEEISNPTVSVVEQFFSVHELNIEEPIAHIENADNQWKVFLNIKGVNYFWLMLLVEQDNKARPDFGSSSEFVQVYLTIGSQKLSAQIIEERLKLAPTKSVNYGDLLAPGKSSKTYKEHRFYYEPKVPKVWDFEQKIKNLISELALRKEPLNELAQDSDWCQINIAYYGWQEQMWGCHFDIEDIKRLSEMNVSVDIDLYAQGPELPDN